MGTNVTYNGVLLKNCVTRRFEETVVYDSSGTDAIGQKFALSFQCILHMQDLYDSPALVAFGIGGDDGARNSAELHAFVRQALLTPRKNLHVSFGPDTVLKAIPATDKNIHNDDRDTNNGPKPMEVSIDHVAGNKVFRIRFSIEVTKLECPSKNKSSLVLNNRWSIAESRDDNFFTSRTITGEMRLSASPSSPKSNIAVGHSFLHSVVPPLEDGFKRERIEFASDVTGLGCSYTITDRQTRDAAPWPATKITGNHTESTANGINFFSSVMVRLEGPPHADQKALIARAVQVVDAKLAINSRVGEEVDFFIDQASITASIGEVNAVEVNIRVRQMKAEPRQYLANLRKDHLGSTLKLPSLQVDGTKVSGKYDVKKSPVPALYGYDSHGKERRPAVLFLLHCYLQNPCNNVHSVSAAIGSLKEDKKKTKRSDKTTITESSEYRPEQGDTGLYDKEAFKAVYTMYKMSSTYETIENNVAMPIARVLSKQEMNSAGRPKRPGSGGNRNSGAAATSVVLSLTDPQTVRTIIVEGERVSKRPEFPSPTRHYQDGTLIGTLMQHDIEWMSETPTPDGRNFVYSGRASYVYSMNRPPLPKEKLRVGILPWTNPKAGNDRGLINLGEVYNEKVGP